MNKNKTSLLSKIIPEDIREEYRDVLIGTMIGVLVRIILLQVIKYLQKHPQLLNLEKTNNSNPSISKPKKPFSRIWSIKKLSGGSLLNLPLLDSLSNLAPYVGSILGFVF